MFSYHSSSQVVPDLQDFISRDPSSLQQTVCNSLCAHFKRVDWLNLVSTERGFFHRRDMGDDPPLGELHRLESCTSPQAKAEQGPADRRVLSQASSQELKLLMKLRSPFSSPCIRFSLSHRQSKGCFFRSSSATSSHPPASTPRSILSC